MTDRELLLALLESNSQILERLDRLEASVNRISPEPRLSREDRLLLQRLLPVLYATFAAKDFTARDVVESLTLRPLCAGRSVKSIGKLFARATGVFINGVMIQRSGEARNSTLWILSSLGLSPVSDAFKAA